MSTFTPTFSLTMDFATNHYGIPQGIAGRDGNVPVAICLHALQTTLESYLSFMHSDILYSDLRPGQRGSVHYAIEVGGAIRQFVRESDTAWGLQDLHNTTWPLIGDYSGIEPDYLFVHIGLESFAPQAPRAMFVALSQLIAYISLNQNITVDALHVISHTALDDTYAQCIRALLTNVISVAHSLAAEGNPNASVNVAQLSQQVAAMQTQLDTLQSDFDAAQGAIETFGAHPAVIAQDAILGHIKSSTSIKVDPTSGIAQVATLAAVYNVDTGATLQTIVPNIAAIIQFASFVFDQNPAWMTLGNFQHINVSVPGLYRLRVKVQFASADWTKDSTIQLTRYKNGASFSAIALKQIETNHVADIVTVEGENIFVINSASDSYDVRVLTNDTTSTSPTKQIASGTLAVEKIGM